MVAAGLVLGFAPGPAMAADASVEVVNNAFEPDQVTIKAGEKVTWRFTGTAPHSVTADDGSFDSHPGCRGSNLIGCSSAASPPFEHTFAAAGTVPYHCKIHGSPGGGGMAGVVVVQSASSGTTAPPTTSASTTTSPPTTARRATTTTSEAAATIDDESTTSTSAPEESTTTSSTSTTVELAVDIGDDDDGGNGAMLALILAGIVAVLAAGGYAGYQLYRQRTAGPTV